MSVRTYLIPQGNVGDNGGFTTNFYLCDLVSELPVSGLQQSDRAYVVENQGTYVYKAAGGVRGGFELITVEIDLGSVPLYSGSFDISGLYGLIPGAQVQASQRAIAYTGKGTLPDECEMDMLVVTGYVLSDTVIRCFWNAVVGPVVGNIKFGYAVSAV